MGYFAQIVTVVVQLALLQETFAQPVILDMCRINKPALLVVQSNTLVVMATVKLVINLAVPVSTLARFV